MRGEGRRLRAAERPLPAPGIAAIQAAAGPCSGRLSVLQARQVRLRPPGNLGILKKGKKEKKVHKGLFLHLLITLMACLQDARHCATVETKVNNLSCPCPQGS